MGKRPFVEGAHVWDNPASLQRLTGTREWETVAEPATDVGDLSDEDQPFVPELTSDEAGLEFVQMLLDLLFAGKVAAKHLCVLCFWASKAGVKAAGPYAFRPDAPSGHFQRHLDLVLGAKVADTYEIALPGHHKFDVSRTVHDNVVLAPHELLHSEVLSAGAEKIQTSITEKQWPPIYWEHDLVQTAQDNKEDLPIPLSVYVDGVPYSRNDSFLGFWTENLATGARNLVALLRKSDLCRCGCKAWCSIFPVLLFIQWSLKTMVAGCFPSSRHDHLRWRASDAARASLAGTALGYKALVLYIKGDWLEFSSTLGFLSWSVATAPCMWCDSSVQDLFNFIGISPLGIGGGKRDYDADEYDAACAAAEIRCTIATREQHRSIVNALRYDKKKKGAAGRALTRPFPDLGLLQGDRLEPCDSLQDVGSFDNIKGFPVTVLFWRPSAQTRVKHRCPWFCAETAVSTECIGIDVLHTLHLGVVSAFTSVALWLLLSANLYGIVGLTDEMEQLGVLKMRADLFTFYDQWDAAHRPHRCSRLGDLTVAMLGPKSQPKLHARAVETLYVFFFVCHMLEQHAAKITQGDQYLEAARALRQYLIILKEEPLQLSRGALQRLVDLCKRHLIALSRLNFHFFPKHHAFVHLTLRMAQMGNARFYSTFHDESVNGVMATIAGSCHRLTWQSRCLQKYSSLEANAGRPQKIQGHLGRSKPRNMFGARVQVQPRVPVQERPAPRQPDPPNTAPTTTFARGARRCAATPSTPPNHNAQPPPPTTACARPSHTLPCSTQAGAPDEAVASCGGCL